MNTDITSGMNHEFRCSKLYRFFMLSLQALIGIASVIATGKSETWLGWYGLFVLVLGSLSLWMRQISQKRFACGEKYRRLLFFSKGLNEDIPPYIVASILAEYKDADQTSELREDEYYDSGASPGNIRMLENLQESSFYTKKLASTSKDAFGAIALIGLVVAFIYLLFIASTADPRQDAATLHHAAELTTKLIAFALFGSYFEYWYSFRALAQTAEQIYHDVSAQLEKQGDHTKEVLKLISTYDCALAASTAIPTWAWKLHKSALEKGWDRIKVERPRSRG